MKSVCIALLAAGLWLSPGFVHAQLKLEEVRPTYGRLGTTRTSTRVLPGDELVVEYVVSGVVPDAEGMVNVEVVATLENANHKVISEVPAASKRSVLALGGARFPGLVYFSLPPDCEPGRYVVRGKISDLNQRKSVLLEQDFEVLPPAFGVIRLRLASDSKGALPTGGNLTVNQPVFFHATVVGFSRQGKAIHVDGNMVIVDSDGRKTLLKPDSVGIRQEVDDGLDYLDFNWPIVANRPGRFVVQVEFRDEISKKTVVHELPINVQPAPSLRNDMRGTSRRNN